VEIESQIVQLLTQTLALGDRTRHFNASTVLLGAVPELDSMGVLNLISAIEERFGIVVHDDDIDGETFATVSSLVGYVAGKLNPR
jgi:acyl carrier protein